MLLLALAVSPFLGASPLHAAPHLPDSPMERVEVFSTCAGRMDALTTRLNARHDAKATETLRMRDEFDMLAEAMMPLDGSEADRQDDSIRSRRWRHRGWSEISTLFGDIDYALDLRKARRAEASLEAKTAVCARLLLPTG